MHIYKNIKNIYINLFVRLLVIYPEGIPVEFLHSIIRFFLKSGKEPWELTDLNDITL